MVRSSLNRLHLGRAEVRSVQITCVSDTNHGPTAAQSHASAMRASSLSVLHRLVVSLPSQACDLLGACIRTFSHVGCSLNCSIKADVQVRAPAAALATSPSPCLHRCRCIPARTVEWPRLVMQDLIREFASCEDTPSPGQATSLCVNRQGGQPLLHEMPQGWTVPYVIPPHASLPSLCW